MSGYKKPLPVIQPHSAEFWIGTKQGKLLIQNCDDCHSPMTYPRKFCSECWSTNLGWKESSGKGTIYSFSVTYEGVEPIFHDDLPIILAWIDLPEGVRMTTNIINCEPENVKIGMNVEVVFKPVTAEVTLHYFQPTD